MEILIFLALGAVAGWLAGVLMKGFGFGLVGNIIIGVIGSFIGGYLFSMLGISMGGMNPMIGSIIVAVIGAILLLFVVGFFFKK